MEIENLGQASDAAYRLRARCDWGKRREGLKSVRACGMRYELDRPSDHALDERPRLSGVSALDPPQMPLVRISVRRGHADTAGGRPLLYACPTAGGALMGKSLPRTVLEATLAGWQNIEIKCDCGRDQTVPLAAVSPYGPDLVAYARRLRCTTCGTAPTAVRLHRRVITPDGPKTVTGPIAGLAANTR